MMTNANIDKLGITIAETTIREAGRIAHERGIAATIDVDRLQAAIRKHAKAAALKILDDGRALVSGGMDGWLPALLVTECNAAALAAVDEATADDGPAKSSGHICFDDGVEYFQIGTEVYRAQVAAPLADMQHGARHGRWECSRSHFDRCRGTVYPAA